MSVVVTVAMAVAMLLCMCAVGFFAGVESGMLNVSRARMMSLVRAGSPRANKLAKSLADMPRVITTVLVGTNLFSVLASTLSAALCMRIFPESAALRSVWSALMALAVLFGCEYMPKLFFTTRPIRRLLMFTPLYRFAEKALSPVVSVFQAMVRALFRQPAAVRPRRLSMSRDGLRTLVADNVNGARLSGFERRLIERVLALQTVFAEQLMTPIDRTDKVRVNTPLSECLALARRTGHVHLPVFDVSGHKAVGALDILSLLRMAGGEVPDGVAGEVARPPLVISSRTRADDILPMMRRMHTPVAAVEDASAARVVGLVTEENILQALMGGC
jgi:CBS domain containing-hemolysin-like protein